MIGPVDRLLVAVGPGANTVAAGTRGSGGAGVAGAGGMEAAVVGALGIGPAITSTIPNKI